MNMDPERFRQAMRDMEAAVDENDNPWVALHVMYEKLTEAGFSSRNACTVIGTMLARLSDQ